MTALTVAMALVAARAKGVDGLDAQLLLVRALGCTRTWLLAHEDAVIEPGQATGFRSDISRRAEGEPLAYLLGEKEFYGLMLGVNPSVLVPRPETEILVDWASELLGAPQVEASNPHVLDLGTGSGAIALALKRTHPNAQISALDLSLDALAVARSNALRLGLAVEFRCGHWWDGFGEQRFHVVVSNPPYVDPADANLAALRHEPGIALVSSGGGLLALATIVAGAADHLEPGGWLVLEHGNEQAPAVRSLLQRHGFVEVQTRQDLAGWPRCSGGHL